MHIIYQSPMGDLLIEGNAESIHIMKFCDSLPEAEQERRDSPDEEPDWKEQCIQQLDDYFAGRLSHFSLPLDLQGTDFQKRVWKALQEVPNGAVCSYQSIADALGNPGSVRAVASANARNPAWIVVPCHRIIGSDRALRGYAGGIHRKAALLELEGCSLSDERHDKRTRVL